MPRKGMVESDREIRRADLARKMAEIIEDAWVDLPEDGWELEARMRRLDQFTREVLALRHPN